LEEIQKDRCVPRTRCEFCGFYLWSWGQYFCNRESSTFSKYGHGEEDKDEEHFFSLIDPIESMGSTPSVL